MIQLQFTEAGVAALIVEHYHHPHPRVQRKMEALWLNGQGLGHQEICRLTRISATTLTGYLRAYQAGGIKALKALRWYRPASALSNHHGMLEGYFREHLPASGKEAMGKLAELTGVHRSENRVCLVLQRMGMRCRTVGLVPAKAEVEAQEACKKTP